jgi:hypothetical protein
MTVAGMLLANVVVPRDGGAMGTIRHLGRMCVVRTATQREVQQESCGRNEGDECSHSGPTKDNFNCSL